MKKRPFSWLLYTSSSVSSPEQFMCHAKNFKFKLSAISSVQLSSVAQSYLTLCYSMDWSTPGLPVHHQLLEFTQTHAHSVSDTIQPSHPLLSPSSPAFNLSQHHGLFKWVSSLHQVAKVSGLISFRIGWFDLLAVLGTLPTPQFKSINSLALNFLYDPTLTSIHDWKNCSFDYMDLCQ